MVIYVDVLVFLNTVVDFLILSVAARLTHINLKLWRKLVAAVISALFSLYIFLPPQGFIVELLLRLVSSSVAVIIGFGFGNLRRFLRCLFTFYAASFLYAGLMAGIWMLLEPDKMSMNNGVVYFDISPLVLITASLVFYIVIVVVKKLTGKEAKFADRCEITLCFNQKTAKSQAMVDSGHTLNDAFGSSIVMIADKSLSAVLFGEADTEKMLMMNVPEAPGTAKRFRLIPVNTVSGEKLLPAIKVDRAEILSGNKTFRLIKPTVVISGTALGDDYSVIIPPHALNY